MTNATTAPFQFPTAASINHNAIKAQVLDNARAILMRGIDSVSAGDLVKLRDGINSLLSIDAPQEPRVPVVVLFANGGTFESIASEIPIRLRILDSDTEGAEDGGSEGDDEGESNIVEVDGSNYYLSTFSASDVNAAGDELDPMYVHSVERQIIGQ